MARSNLRTRTKRALTACAKPLRARIQRGAFLATLAASRAHLARSNLRVAPVPCAKYQAVIVDRWFDLALRCKKVGRSPTRFAFPSLYVFNAGRSAVTAEISGAAVWSAAMDVGGWGKEAIMAIYMDYEGIKGSSTADGHKDLIVLDSFNFGVSRNITPPSASREASEPSLTGITATKLMDASSPKLFIESVAGNLQSAVQIHFTTTTANRVIEFLLYTLTNVGVSRYSVSAGADDIPVETLVLNFTKIEMTFTGMGPDVSGSPETVGYDLATMQTV
jgi:type VI secretion system secreted protein Hcp